MRKGIVLALVACMAATGIGQRGADEAYDLGRTGIDWHEGLGAVVDQGKPILLFQLMGDFDRLHC